MSKQIIKNYTFNATAKTVTLTDYVTVMLERLALIVDTTTNTILYNFADNTGASASVSSNVITLSTVGSAASTDKLQIIYDAVTGDPTYDTQSMNVTQLNGTTIDVSSGLKSAGTQRVVLATDQPALTNALKVDGSAVTQPVSGSLASISTSVTPGVATANLGKAEDAPHTSGDTGVFMLGVRNDTVGTLTSTDGDYSPIAVDGSGRPKILSTGFSNLSDGTELTTAHGLKVTLEGTAANATAVKVDNSAVTQPAALSATTAAVGSTAFFTSALTTAQTIKSSAGNLFYLHIINSNTTDAYLQVFDNAGTITLGTTVPTYSFLVPAAANSNGAWDQTWTIPLKFANAIKVAATTTVTGATTVTTGLVVNGSYI